MKGFLRRVHNGNEVWALSAKARLESRLKVTNFLGWYAHANGSLVNIFRLPYLTYPSFHDNSLFHGLNRSLCTE